MDISSKLSGGAKLEEYLKGLAAKVGQGGTLQVGFFEDATYPDGTPVALVAATNEFGGTIAEREVPASEIQVYRKLQADGDFANGGQFVKKSQSNFEETHAVPAHVIPEHTVPPRPFFRRMISLGSPHWGDDLAKLLVATSYNVKRALGLLGKSMDEELQESILAQVYAPLAQSTVDAKGNDKQLVETGLLLRSVADKVEQS